MDIESFRNYCIAKKGVTESFPFDDKILVFKVMGKVFALTSVEDYELINLKCDPDKSIELRERHHWITPGYHMSKKHWNSIVTESIEDEKLVLELIDHSYDLVVKGLTKKLKEELAAL